MTLRLVIMGVAGCGKYVVGAGVAAALCVPYPDGDDLHPTANVEKMRAGLQLTMTTAGHGWTAWPGCCGTARPVIVGCSALRRTYRDRIRNGAGGPVRFVHLAGRRAVIAERMALRTGHFMPLSLLESQFAALGPPTADEALTVDIDQPLAVLVAAIVANAGVRL